MQLCVLGSNLFIILNERERYERVLRVQIVKNFKIIFYCQCKLLQRLRFIEVAKFLARNGKQLMRNIRYSVCIELDINYGINTCTYKNTDCA